MAHILDDTILKPIEAVIAGAYAQGRNVLYEHEVYAVLSKLGLNTPNHFLVRNEKEITDSLLYRFGSEKIVLKIVAPELTHKQEVGGVQMVLKDMEFVKYTYNRMKSDFAARIVKIVHQYKKPTAVSVNVASGIDAIYNKLGQTLDTGGVPAFLSAKRAMLCLNALSIASFSLDSNTRISYVYVLLKLTFKNI